MRCSVFRNLLLIEQVQGMVSLPLIFLLLVLLFLFLLIIMLLRIMMLKLIQLVRTQTKVNLSQEHPLSKIRRKLKTLGLRRLNSQKPKQKKYHLCHHYGVAGHTRLNCYKWLATQQSNGMIASGSQNKLQFFLAPLEDLLKALMFLSNLNGFNFSLSLLIQGFNQRKGSSKVWKENGSK